MNFTNATLVGHGYDPEKYVAFQKREGAKRGDHDFVMSRGELMTFAECPHKWINGFEDPMSGSKEWGSLIDVAVLDPERFESKYVVTPETYPDSKTGEQKPWTWRANYCKEWRENFPGRTPIAPEAMAEVRAASKALFADEAALELLGCSKRQVFVTADYKDRETGLIIKIKTLIDLVPDKASKRFGKSLFDLKAMKSAHPAKWTKDVFTYNYDAQGALYRDIYVAATGEDRSSFGHLIQENTPPWEVLNPLPVLTEEFLELGRMKYLNALRFYCHCLKHGKWPSYPSASLRFDVFQFIGPLPWMMGAEGYRPELDVAESADEESEPEGMEAIH